MIATNIKWDTDNNEQLYASLPNEIKIPNDLTTDEQISDYLSEITGFCHFGFDLIED